jgi:hypothetical protein
MNRRAFLGATAGAGVALLGGGCATAAWRQGYLYPQTPGFRELQEELRRRALALTDFHIHIRGGMTPRKAVVREKRSGIGSAVLENFGREWPLKSDADLAAFITECKKSEVGGGALPVGIQVNDRDWHRQISRETFARLDYALADTMIMGVTAEGKPRRLWLEDVAIDDPETWMREYMRHNLQILDEPVTILANPTYLPRCIAHLYDELWSDRRMEEVIAKAVANRVALEIQLETQFARERFLTKAKRMGALFSFGSNNFTDKTRDVANWLHAIRLLDLQPSDVLTRPKRLLYSSREP